MAFTSYSHFHRSKILGLREFKASAMIPQHFQAVKTLEDFPLKVKQQFVKCRDLFLVRFLGVQKDSKLLSNDLVFQINILSICFVL